MKIKAVQRSKVKRKRRNEEWTTERHQKNKLQEDYQTARVAYANCPCADFGF